MPEHRFHTPLPLTLDVSIPSGEVEVETIDGEESTVVVEADERVLENLDVRHDGDRLVVAMRGKSKLGFVVSFGSHVFGNNGIDVHARVPHGSGVKVKTTSADTEIDGRISELELNTVSGDVRVRGETGGDARIKTVSGDVDLGNVGGDLSVQSVSGDLRAGPVAGSADTRSVSGDIRLDALTHGDARFTSVSGDVEIGIVPGTALDVDAGSSSGDLSSEVALSSEPPGGQDGERTVILRGRTVSGDLRVFRAD